MNFNGAAGNDWFSTAAIDAGLPSEIDYNSWGSSEPPGVPLVFPGPSDTAVIGSIVTLADSVNIQSLSLSGTLTGNWTPGTFAYHSQIILSDSNNAVVSVSGLMQNIDLATKSQTVTLNGGGEIKNVQLGIAAGSAYSAVTWNNQDILDGAVYVNPLGTAASYSTFINSNLFIPTEGGFGGYLHITNTSTIGVGAGNLIGFNSNFDNAGGDVIVNNVGGTISAVGAGAVISFVIVTVEGGTLKTSNGGAFSFTGTETLDGTASAVAVDATINIGSPDGIHIQDSLTLEGAINFSAATKINFGSGGNIYLHGGGYTFVSGMWVDANLQGVTGAETLANAGTISSQVGSLVIQDMSLTNTGTIDAVKYQSDQFQIVIGGSALPSGSTTVINKNLIEATGGGNLYIENSGSSQTTLDNSQGGTVFADDGSLVQVVSGARLIGGEVNTQGSGYLFVGGGGILDGTNAAGLTIDAGSTVQGAPLILVGNIINNGAMSSSIIEVAVGTSATLNGVGVLSGFSLGGDSYNSAFGYSAGSLTIGQGQTVHGGVSASDNGYTLVNYGDIQDTDNTGAFGAGGSGVNTFHNYGTYEVAPNGALVIANYGNAGSITFINDADANETGKLVADSGATINIGTTQTVVNNGLFEANGGTMIVDDAVTGTGSGLVTGGGTLQFNSAFSENVAFHGAGALSLGQGQAYKGAISGFSADDSIDLVGLTSNYQTRLTSGPVPSSFTLAVAGNTVTQTNVDGSKLTSRFNIVGQAFTSTIRQFDASGDLTAVEHGGVTGAPFDAFTTLYSGPGSTGNIISGYQLFYANQTSNLTEVDLDGAGDVTRATYDYAGTTPGSETGFVANYVAGEFAGGVASYLALAGATYSTFAEEYDNNFQNVGVVFTFNSTGQTYDEAQYSYTAGAQPKLTEATFSGYTGSGGASVASFFSDNTAQYSYTGITGQAYTSKTLLYNSTNVLIAAENDGYTTKAFSSQTTFYNASGVAQEIVRDYTNPASAGSINGQAYNAYEKILNSAFTLLATAYHLDSGGNVYVGVASGVSSPSFGGTGVSANTAELSNTLTGGDWTITGGGTGETFNFAAFFNKAEITDYGSAFGGATDIVSVSTQDFADWTAMLSDAAPSGGGANTTFTSTTTGDKLTLDGVTVAQLTALTPSQASADFLFHA